MTLAAGRCARALWALMRRRQRNREVPLSSRGNHAGCANNDLQQDPSAGKAMPQSHLKILRRPLRGIGAVSQSERCLEGMCCEESARWWERYLEMGAQKDVRSLRVTEITEAMLGADVAYVVSCIVQRGDDMSNGLTRAGFSPVQHSNQRHFSIRIC